MLDFAYGWHLVRFVELLRVDTAVVMLWSVCQINV